MSISCKCLNIVVRLVGPEAESLPRFDVEAYLQQKRPQQHESTTAAKVATPSDDHFLFFKEALGPVRCSTIEIQFDGLLRNIRIFDEWDLSQCRNCACYVYARNLNDATSTSSARYLVNSTLMTNQEQLSARMSDDNYSTAFGIVLNGSSLSYSDLAAKSKLLSKVKSDNQFVHLLRAYMERETEAANERIQRFTEQEFAVLKVKRERAEQDCLILTKLANNVPELLHSTSSSSNSDHSRDGGIQQTTTGAMVLSSSVSPVATTGTNPISTTNLNDTTASSQLETPPPTPEYLPMSTGNSPPMTTAATVNSRQQTTSSSSSMSTADQSFSSPPGARLNGSAHSAQTRTHNRANLSYNNNNNNIVSFNNTRGAIHRQPPATMISTMTTTTPSHQHSSTNSMMIQQQISTNSFESDCMFDIDGMENDKSPLSNTLSDEEELGFDESSANNNEDGMYIPSRQLGRQNSSIAKSLPISMPQVMTQFRSNVEDFEEMNEDNVDIAASIKALAKSVHGDTVFGDLPRPQVQRFSTQI